MSMILELGTAALIVYAASGSKQTWLIVVLLLLGAYWGYSGIRDLVKLVKERKK